jgi:septal ring factor EnvC (AmiA/AmiB activator)
MNRDKESKVREQIGYIKATIAQLDKDIGRIDYELQTKIPKRIVTLSKKKDKYKEKISKKRRYINELINDLNRLNNE